MILPRIGKLDTVAFEQLIFPYLGANSPRLLLGPRHGVDAAVIALDDAPSGRRRVMVVYSCPAS